MEVEPKIEIRIDLSPDGVRNVRVYADTPEDRDKALGWLNHCLVQIEMLEARLKQLSEGGV